MPRTFADLSSYRRLADVQKANPNSILDSALQGFTQGNQIQNLPDIIQNQAVTRQLQNAILAQKLDELRNPDKAFARKLQEELALKGALNPDLGIERAPAGLEGETIGTPSAITPEQQADLLSNPEGPVPTAAPGAPITPVSFNGIQTGLNVNPNTVEKAAQDKLDRKIKEINARPVPNMIVQGANGIGVVPKTGEANFTTLKDENGNPILPKSGIGKLGGLTPNARIAALKYQGKYGIPLDENDELTNDERGVYEAALKEKEANEKKAEDKDLQNIAKQTETLAKDVQNNKEYQSYRTVSDAVKGLKATLEYAKSNPDDQTGIKSSAIDAFNRIINPNSVVRQQAFAQTTQGQSILNKFDNFFNGLSTGQTITPDQIQSMVDLASSYEAASRESAKKELEMIKNRGDASKIDSKKYLPEITEPTSGGKTQKIGRFTITVH